MSGEKFQQRATKEGRLAQDWAELLLDGVDFRIVERDRRRKDLGVTIKFVVLDQRDNEWFVDVTGAATSPHAGLIRTDTVFKAIGRAAVLKTQECRLLMLTTDLPKSGSGGDRALRLVPHLYFDVIGWNTPTGKARLRRYAKGDAIVPLPGFRTAEEIFGGQLVSGAELGASRKIDLSIVGDPSGTITQSLRVTKMDHRLVVYLPSQTKDAVPLTAGARNNARTAILELLHDFAGGATRQKADGSWTDPLSGVVSEGVEIIESFSTNPFDAQFIQRVVRILLDDLDQHTAAVLVDSDMYQFDRS